MFSRPTTKVQEPPLRYIHIRKYFNFKYNKLSKSQPSYQFFPFPGNLEELLNDIETISQDILAISNGNQQQADHVGGSRRCKSDINPGADRENQGSEKPFKSELNVTLMPQPMPLIGLEKYREIQRSVSKSMENLSGHVFQGETTNNS